MFAYTGARVCVCVCVRACACVCVCVCVQLQITNYTLKIYRNYRLKITSNEHYLTYVMSRPIASYLHNHIHKIHMLRVYSLYAL